MPTMKVRKKRCETCHYGEIEKLKEGEGISELKVRCLKRSPTIDWNTNKGMFPILSAYFWCGQYREQKEAEIEDIEI